MTAEHSPSGQRGPTERLSTGVQGADTVLDGGLLRGRNTLVRGPPGAGKTLFGLHFLAEGATPENGENPLFINFGEPEDYIREDAKDWNIDLDEVHILDLTPSEGVFVEQESYDLFSPAEVEGSDISKELVSTVEEVTPTRVFVDPLTQLRYVTADAYQFRKQVMGLLQFFKQRDITPIFTSQATKATPDDDLQFIADGIIHLDLADSIDGHRTFSVSKFRGSEFQSGDHTLRITGDGMRIAPNLTPEKYSQGYSREDISSGIPELDELLHGGIERGKITMLTGPTGAGKTTTGLQFMKEAAGRGERSVLYSFDEDVESIVQRSEAINIPVKEMIDREILHISDVLPLELTADEFTRDVQREVQTNDAKIVMIDGLDGFRNSLRGISTHDNRAVLSLSRYLKNMGITVILVNEIHQITGEFLATEKGLSYIADNVIFLRHIEYQGELRKVIGVLKMRTSGYEQKLRELEISEYGLRVGAPLSNLHGILSGVPQLPDDGTELQDFEGEDE